jgi:hypothetical protein
VNDGAGTLTLNSNDPCQPVRTVSLNATVVSPQVSVTTATTLFPATVVGCLNSQTVTVSNTGGAELIVSPSVSGAGYSLGPYLGSGTEGIRLAAGASIQLTVNFAPEFVARALLGILTLTSNDPVNPTATVDFCGEGTPNGIRVLVLQRNGRPYPMVDQIMLQSPTGNLNRLNVPLTVINPPDSCEPIQFHYETAPLLSNAGGSAFDMNASFSNNKKKSGSTLHITIKNKHRTINLNPQSCDFQVIVVTM